MTVTLEVGSRVLMSTAGCTEPEDGEVQEYRRAKTTKNRQKRMEPPPGGASAGVYQSIH